MMAKFQARLSMLLKSVFLLTLLVGGMQAQADSRTLVVGINPEYEPLAYMREGKLAGIEIDNAKEVAAAMGKTVKFVPMPFAELFPALEAGKIDVIMSGLSVTEARLAEVDFAEPFMEVGQMAIIRSDDVARLGYPRAIFGKGISVGVEPGTTGDEFAQNSMPNATIKYFDSPDAAFAALRGKVIDLYIHDAPTSWRIANSGEYGDLFGLYRALTKEELAWAVKKGNLALLTEINEALKELEQNGRLKAIQNFWIPVKVEVR